MLASKNLAASQQNLMCFRQCHRLPIYECETSWFVYMCSDRLARIIPSSLTFLCARKKTLWGISELPLDTDEIHNIQNNIFQIFDLSIIILEQLISSSKMVCKFGKIDPNEGGWGRVVPNSLVDAR